MTQQQPADIWTQTPQPVRHSDTWKTLTIIAQCVLVAFGALAFVFAPVDLFMAFALTSIAVSTARTALR